jgi:hypothetical protein
MNSCINIEEKLFRKKIKGSPFRFENTYYKPTFGIELLNEGNKSIKGEPGIGFKLTLGNNYDMDNNV